MSPRSKEQNEKIRNASIANILEAALELFAVKGFDSTSIANIAEKAGVSKGLMYNYFSGKDELLKALLDQLNEGESDMMSSIMDNDPRKTLENCFRLFFKELRDNYQRWVFISKLVAQIDKFDFVRELAIGKYNNYILLVEKLLRSIGFEHPKNEAQLIAGAIDGIGYQYLMLKEKYPLKEVENYLIKKYCRNENS